MAGGKQNFARPFLTFRTDDNHSDISKILRKLGWRVKSTHKQGGGFHDLVIEKHGLNVLAEIKDGDKHFSARQLTADQRKFHFAWRGLKCVLTNEEDCRSIDAQIDRMAMRIADAGIKMEIVGSKDAIYFPAVFDLK